MTLPRTLINIFKKLKTPIEIFDVHERFAPRLQDEKWIYFVRWNERVPEGSVSLSGYQLTRKGREEFKKWKAS